jgi:hypothetical protein
VPPPLRCADASARAAPPHLALAGLTPAVERSAERKRKRGQLKLAVFLRLGCPVVAVPVTHTADVPWLNPPAGSAADGKPSNSMKGAEYASVLRQCLQRLRFPERGGPSTRACSPAVLLHDRDPAHTSLVCRAAAKEEGVLIKLLPSSSPDLTPLDASFFGAIATKWRRQCVQQRLTWHDRAKLFWDLLHSEDPEPHLQRWVQALKACVRTGGGHIEREIRRAKE